MRLVVIALRTVEHDREHRRAVPAARVAGRSLPERYAGIGALRAAARLGAHQRAQRRRRSVNMLEPRAAVETEILGPERARGEGVAVGPAAHRKWPRREKGSRCVVVIRTVERKLGDDRERETPPGNVEKAAVRRQPRTAQNFRRADPYERWLVDGSVRGMGCGPTLEVLPRREPGGEPGDGNAWSRRRDRFV